MKLNHISVVANIDMKQLIRNDFKNHDTQLENDIKGSC